METTTTETIDQQPALAAVTPPDSRSLRAYRHGFTGQIILLTEADRIAYANHCQGFFKSLAPQGAIQNNLCQAIADDRWRLQRAASLESAIFAAEITEPDKLVTGDAEVDTTLAMGRAWLSKGGNLQLLTLYESRIQRRFEKNMAELRLLQDRQKAVLDQALEDADLLAQLAESKGEDPDPVVRTIFARFDFSSNDGLRLLRRHRDLREAKKRFQEPKKPAKRAA